VNKWQCLYQFLKEDQGGILLHDKCADIAQRDCWEKQVLVYQHNNVM
jgi:hypothetical protein